MGLEMTHLYAFGSIIRGEVDEYSDIDLLAIKNEYDSNFSVDKFSIYSEKRLKELWKTGNPFAWHLHFESVQLYSSDGRDPIKEYGAPSIYKNGEEDCLKFYLLFKDAYNSLTRLTNSACFELSAIFLSIRNFATCFTLHTERKTVFSRSSAIMIGKNSAPISKKFFDICLRARILSTRGNGNPISQSELTYAMQELTDVEKWMIELLEKVKS